MELSSLTPRPLTKRVAAISNLWGTQTEILIFVESVTMTSQGLASN